MGGGPEFPLDATRVGVSGDGRQGPLERMSGRVLHPEDPHQGGGENQPDLDPPDLGQVLALEPAEHLLRAEELEIPVEVDDPVGVEIEELGPPEIVEVEGLAEEKRLRHGPVAEEPAQLLVSSAGQEEAVAGLEAGTEEIGDLDHLRLLGRFQVQFREFASVIALTEQDQGEQEEEGEPRTQEGRPGPAKRPRPQQPDHGGNRE